MKSASRIKNANMACALLQGAGFWLLSLYSQWGPMRELVPLAVIYPLSLWAAAWLVNRGLSKFAARRGALKLAAAILPMVYGYIILFCFSLVTFALNSPGSEWGIQEALLSPIGLMLWGAGATIPLWALFSLGLGIAFMRAVRAEAEEKQ